MEFDKIDNYVKILNKAIWSLSVAGCSTKGELCKFRNLSNDFNSLDINDIVNEILSNGCDVFQYLPYYKAKCKVLLNSTFDFDPEHCIFCCSINGGEPVERDIDDLVFIAETNNPDPDLDLTEEEYYEALGLVRSVCLDLCLRLEELKYKIKEIEDTSNENDSDNNGEQAVHQEYGEGLLALFHGNSYLLTELVGKSDTKIAEQIKRWAKTRDNLGRPLIENPENSLRSSFAKELKKQDLIKCSERTFRNYL